MGIRTRDQVWQLMLVAVATSLVLMTVGILALRSGDDDADTSAGGLTITDDTLTGQALSSSSAADEQGGRSEQRSAGIIDEGDSSDDDESSSELPVVVSTTESSTTTTTVAVPETTSDTKPSTSVPQPTATTEKETTTESTVVPTTVAKETTTDPVYTILPTTSEVDNSVTRKQLAAARERWGSSGFDSYSMVVTRSCFCTPDALGPFEVVVRNGDVKSVGTLGGNRPVADWMDPRSLTVPGLFALIESSLGAHSLDVQFDKNNGIPRRISIDPRRMIADDELTVTVDDFQPRRTR